VVVLVTHAIWNPKCVRWRPLWRLGYVGFHIQDSTDNSSPLRVLSNAVECNNRCVWCISTVVA
jgi:hypothetical protein